MKYLTTAVIILMLGFGACAKGDPETDFRVQPVEGGKSIEITDYVGSKRDVIIPSKIQGLPVTHIGEDAFERKNLTSVRIPNSVTTIMNDAFYGNPLNPTTKSPLIGRWEGHDRRENERVKPIAFEFLEDGEFKMYIEDSVNSGLPWYDIGGGKLLMDNHTYSYKITGSELTLIYDNDGHVWVLNRKK